MSQNPQALVILGNGFDLHLKLKSKFTDFLSEYYIDCDLKEETEILISFAETNDFDDVQEYHMNSDKIPIEIINKIDKVMKNYEISPSKKKKSFLFYLKIYKSAIEYCCKKVNSNLRYVYSLEESGVVIEQQLIDLYRIMYNKLEELVKNIEARIQQFKNHRLNFWTIYFLWLRYKNNSNNKYYKLKDWNDVEKQILLFFSDSNRNFNYSSFFKLLQANEIYGYILLDSIFNFFK